MKNYGGHVTIKLTKKDKNYWRNLAIKNGLNPDALKLMGRAWRNKVAKMIRDIKHKGRKK